jgi:hypothetical protein
MDKLQLHLKLIAGKAASLRAAAKMMGVSEAKLPRVTPRARQREPCRPRRGNVPRASPKCDRTKHSRKRINTATVERLNPNGRGY